MKLNNTHPYNIYINHIQYLYADNYKNGDVAKLWYSVHAWVSHQIVWLLIQIPCSHYETDWSFQKIVDDKTSSQNFFLALEVPSIENFNI